MDRQRHAGARRPHPRADEAGYATFADPGVFWQATKQFAISAASNVQLAGKAKGVSGNLEISDFGQHLVKVKAAYAF